MSHNLEVIPLWFNLQDFFSPWTSISTTLRTSYWLNLKYIFYRKLYFNTIYKILWRYPMIFCKKYVSIIMLSHSGQSVTFWPSLNNVLVSTATLHVPMSVEWQKKSLKTIILNINIVAPMGVLAPGSAHAWPSAQPPIDVSGVTIKHLPQPLRSHIWSFGKLGQIWKFSKKKLKNLKIDPRGPEGGGSNFIFFP